MAEKPPVLAAIFSNSTVLIFPAETERPIVWIGTWAFIALSTSSRYVFWLQTLPSLVSSLQSVKRITARRPTGAFSIASTAVKAASYRQVPLPVTVN